MLFQSTPSARRATSYYDPMLANLGISIHALREEGDSTSIKRHSEQSNFNPRPPRGGLLSHNKKPLGAEQFQSTPTARRATTPTGITTYNNQDFNPRPPRGGRRYHVSLNQKSHKFQSTPSARRATFFPDSSEKRASISIHALREEGDRYNVRNKKYSQLFQSTPSARRATRREQKQRNLCTFQSTPSARRATLAVVKLAGFLVISIHALREEGDM